jgi:hypothetical protein
MRVLRGWTSAREFEVTFVVLFAFDPVTIEGGPMSFEGESYRWSMNIMNL